MLETIHEYARERLLERADAETTHRRHARVFSVVGRRERTEPGRARTGGVVRAAGDRERQPEGGPHLGDRARGGELGLRLARALRPFWYARGHYVEGRGWVARFLGGLGELFVEREDYVRARDLYEEVLALSRQMEDASTLVDCLIGLGYISLFSRDHLKATALGEEAVMLSRERGYTADLARALNCLGGPGCWKETTNVPEIRTRKASRCIQSWATGRSPPRAWKGWRASPEPGATRAVGQPLRRRRGGGLPPRPAQRALREPYLAAARSLIDEATWQAAYDRGGPRTSKKPSRARCCKAENLPPFSAIVPGRGARKEQSE